MKIIFSVALILSIIAVSGVALAIHDKELESVYSEVLIIPPELRSEVATSGESSWSGSEFSGIKPTPAELDFLSMFSIE